MIARAFDASLVDQTKMPGVPVNTRGVAQGALAFGSPVAVAYRADVVVVPIDREVGLHVGKRSSKCKQDNASRLPFFNGFFLGQVSLLNDIGSNSIRKGRLDKRRDTFVLTQSFIRLENHASTSDTHGGPSRVARMLVSWQVLPVQQARQGGRAGTSTLQ